jgi:hypothetical protein
MSTNRKQPPNKNHFSFFPIEGYFFFTARFTLAFSAGVPDCETRDNAFLACASFSIGYFRLSGSAKDLVGSAFRAAVESFALCDLISGIEVAITVRTKSNNRGALPSKREHRQSIGCSMPERRSTNGIFENMPMAICATAYASALGSGTLTLAALCRIASPASGNHLRDQSAVP